MKCNFTFSAEFCYVYDFGKLSWSNLYDIKMLTRKCKRTLENLLWGKRVKLLSVVVLYGLNTNSCRPTAGLWSILIITAYSRSCDNHVVTVCHKCWTLQKPCAPWNIVYYRAFLPNRIVLIIEWWQMVYMYIIYILCA